jgi:hypothetical protein
MRLDKPNNYQDSFCKGKKEKVKLKEDLKI